MKSVCKLILTAAAVAMIAVPAANAQCIPAQVFGNTGLAMLGMLQVEVVTGTAENAGNEIGSFWAANNGAANNFAGGCPSTNTADPASSWWVVTMAGNRGVNGALGGGGTVSPCIASSCPDVVADEMIYVVEDYGPAGPPGVGDTAFFVAWRVDATPAEARIWDLARPTGAANINFAEFPYAEVVSSNKAGDNVNTTQRYVDLGLNVYGQNAGGAIPDTASIVSYDVCTFVGADDPGRDRALWSCDQSVPYAGGDATGVSVVIDCSAQVDTWVAVGATFVQGRTSQLVGKATAIQCNPDLADPDLNQRPSIRPKRTRSTGR